MEPSPANRFRVNISILIFLIAQLGAAIWWAAGISASVRNTSLEVEALKLQINSGSAVYLTRENINDILGIRDEQISSLKESQERIERKLDILIDSQ